MFVMVGKVIVRSFSTFTYACFCNSMSSCLLMSLLWRFYVYRMWCLHNFIQMVEVVYKHLGCCVGLYLFRSPVCFLYFCVTRPKYLLSWLSLVSRSSACVLDAYSQSSKKFQYSFFTVMVKEAG